MIFFLLGRPGCGKSEIYKYIQQKNKEKSITRIDDFPKLWKIFQEEEKTKRWIRVRKTPDGGYKVIDENVWDDILKDLNNDLLEIKNKYDVVFVEFSRNNYKKALKNFSPEVFKDSVILYIDSDFEKCWERNVKRHKKALAQGTDDHLVSREEMEETYKFDDKEKLLEFKLAPVYLIDNNSTLENFKKNIEKVFKKRKIMQT